MALIVITSVHPSYRSTVISLCKNKINVFYICIANSWEDTHTQKIVTTILNLDIIALKVISVRPSVKCKDEP